MEIDVSRFYDNNYEIINDTKIRFFELEGPLSYILPDRTKIENDSKNTKKTFSKLLTKVNK